jgi:hypothetical protein
MRKTIYIPLIVMVSIFIVSAVHAEAAKVEMKYTTSPAVSGLITPVRALKGGVVCAIMSNSGKIAIAGRDVGVSALRKGRTTVMAVDIDGDGQFGPAEARPVGRNKSAAFMLKLKEPVCGQKTYPFILHQILVYTTRSGQVARIYCCALPAWGMSGSAAFGKVSLIDSNMDGKFTQDGTDSIALGGTKCAVPLVTRHSVGGKFYDLQVTQDGSSVTFTEATGLEIGAAQPLTRTAQCKAMVLTDGKQAYDIISTPKIPGGEYGLVYALYQSGAYLAVMLPPKHKFPITAEKLNVLRAGPPVSLQSVARFSGTKLMISPTMNVVGVGGELFKFYPEVTTQPYYAFVEGNKILKKGKFEKG